MAAVLFRENLIVDPKDPEKLFKPDLILLMSVNGGKSFSEVSSSRHMAISMRYGLIQTIRTSFTQETTVACGEVRTAVRGGHTRSTCRFRSSIT